MADLHITGELAERIRKAAEDANMEIEEILDSKFPPEQGEAQIASKPIPGTFGELATLARKANISSGQSDISERSREILDEEFPEYLARYQEEQDEDE